MDIPGQKQISAYAGRGILSESCGPVWMIGTGMSPNHFPLFTDSYSSARQLVCVFSFHFSIMSLVLIINKAEHHVLYQYHLVNAANHYMGLIQTETVSSNKFYIYVCNLIDMNDFCDCSLISNPNLHLRRLSVSIPASMIPLFMEEIRRRGG